MRDLRTILDFGKSNAVNPRMFEIAINRLGLWIFSRSDQSINDGLASKEKYQASEMDRY